MYAQLPYNNKNKCKVNKQHVYKQSINVATLFALTHSEGNGEILY